MAALHPHRQLGITVRDKQRISNPLRNVLCILLVTAALVSVPLIGRWSPLPTESLLDTWIIVFILACIFWGKTNTTFTITFLALYLMGRAILAIYNDSPMEDFLQAHRWILYLIAFSFAVDKRWGSTRGLVRVMWVLLSLAFLKAALTLIVYGPEERPGLLTENNFEIALFAGLIVTLYRFLGRGQLWAVSLMGGLTVLAGSRSGAVAFLLLAVFAIFQTKRANILVKYLLGLSIPALVLIPVWIFEQRSNGSKQIDRINFLGVFLDETSSWGLLTWIFGTVPITPLSPAGCEQLSFYKLLFSSEGDGSCYSVIFHSHILRIVFDAGILGLLILFCSAWLILRRSNVQVGIALTLVLIAFTNSLSVSGLNNPYVALPFLLAIVTASSDVGEPKQTRSWSRAMADDDRQLLQQQA